LELPTESTAANQSFKADLAQPSFICFHIFLPTTEKQKEPREQTAGSPIPLSIPEE
jgi:hypothetical protein